MTESIEDKPLLIVDTDIISYWLKGDTRGVAYQAYTYGRRLAVSFITVGELFYWALYHSWGPNKVKVLKQQLFQYQVITSTEKVCQKFAEARMPPYKNAQFQPISYSDYWIAACALAYDCPVLTNNYSHFSRIKGIKLLGPYSN